MFDRLCRLHVDDQRSLDISTQLDLFLRCPNLKNLGWADFECTQINEHPILDTNCIPEWQWNHLEDLAIHQHFRDTQVAILKGIAHGNLVDLILHDCHLEEQASMALRPHFSTLVSLNLTGCRRLRSHIVRDVLLSCPRLETLSAKAVRGRDVASRDPWACQRLRMLSIGFLFRDTELDQLSTKSLDAYRH
jgi:hypothetical protein